MIWALWVSCSGRACWSLPAFHLPRPEPTKLEIGGVHKPESTPVPPTPTNTHAHSVLHLSHPYILIITANWAAPFVDLGWNVPFYWAPGILAFVPSSGGWRRTWL